MTFLDVTTVTITQVREVIYARKDKIEKEVHRLEKRKDQFSQKHLLAQERQNLHRHIAALEVIRLALHDLNEAEAKKQIGGT